MFVYRLAADGAFVSEPSSMGMAILIMRDCQIGNSTIVRLGVGMDSGRETVSLPHHVDAFYRLADIIYPHFPISSFTADYLLGVADRDGWFFLLDENVTSAGVNGWANLARFDDEEEALVFVLGYGKKIKKTLVHKVDKF